MRPTRDDRSCPAAELPIGRKAPLPATVLALLATYAALLVCWSLVMSRLARAAVRTGAQPEAHRPGVVDDADPWAELDESA